MPVKPEDRGEAAKLRRVLGARVREAREALGWSQETLAEEVGVGVETLGRYERASKFPSHVTLVRLAYVRRKMAELARVSRDG
jgi:transcriptional regulator with XRE-family HTH domain